LVHKTAGFDDLKEGGHKNENRGEENGHEHKDNYFIGEGNRMYTCEKDAVHEGHNRASEYEGGFKK